MVYYNIVTYNLADRGSITRRERGPKMCKYSSSKIYSNARFIYEDGENPNYIRNEFLYFYTFSMSYVVQMQNKVASEETEVASLGLT